jgi:large subunit ribosomal protein L5
MIDYKTVEQSVLTKLEMTNRMSLPKLQKIVLNIGIGHNKTEPKLQEEAIATLAIISGQKPILTKAKKSISGFKLREGEPVGVKVTLRGAKMLSFVERLASVTLPRIRDFHGLDPRKFDRQGNYTFAVKEQMVFPEIPYDNIKVAHGVEMTFSIKQSDPTKSRILLESLGIPFMKDESLNQK